MSRLICFKRLLLINCNMKNNSAALEAILFVANKPLALNELSKLFSLKESEVETLLEELIGEYQERQGGLRLIKSGTKYQLVTAPETAAIVREFLQDEMSGELTRPSLEALTIIAYRGPIAKIDLDRIRGVNCALILRNLLIRGLIEEEFDKQKNETYYRVSLDFIRYLGVNRVEELPDYEKLHQDESIDRLINRVEGENI